MRVFPVAMELMSLSFLPRFGARVGIAALIASAACSHVPATPASATSARSATLVFANESANRAAVWAVAPAVNTRRIGTVLAGETSTIRVPDDFATQGRVSFYAKVGGSTAMPLTETYSFQPGEELRVRLERDGRTLAKVR